MLRDAALIGVLYAAGLRRAEVVALEHSDYDPESGALIVRGKGNKESIAYIDDGAAEAMGEWLRLRGDELGPLFCPCRKSGEIACPQDERSGHLRHSADTCEESESSTIFTARPAAILCFRSPRCRGRHFGRAAVRWPRKCHDDRSLRPPGRARQEESCQIPTHPVCDRRTRLRIDGHLVLAIC